MSRLLAQIKSEELVEILRFGIADRFQYEVFLITWTNPDKTVVWQVRTKKVPKMERPRLNMYIRGIVDCFNWMSLSKVEYLEEEE